MLLPMSSTIRCHHPHHGLPLPTLVYHSEPPALQSLRPVTPLLGSVPALLTPLTSLSKPQPLR